MNSILPSARCSAPNSWGLANQLAGAVGAEHRARRDVAVGHVAVDIEEGIWAGRADANTLRSGDA
jgi:hypothetical protein